MEDRSFFGALFDFSFSSYVTTKIIKLLYALAIFFAGVIAFGIILSAFANSGILGVFTLLISPLIFLLYVAAARVSLELVMVIFRIADNTDHLRSRTQQKDMPTPPVSAP